MALTSWNNTVKDEDVFIHAFQGDEQDIFLTIGGVTNVVTIEQAVKIMLRVQGALSEKTEAEVE
jgi:hypothetical protein